MKMKRSWKKALAVTSLSIFLTGLVLIPENLYAAPKGKSVSEVAQDAEDILTIFQKSWRKAHDIKEVKKETKKKSEGEAALDMIAGPEKHTEDVTLKGDPSLSDFEWVADQVKDSWLRYNSDTYEGSTGVTRFMGRDAMLGEWKVLLLSDYYDWPDESTLNADSDFSFMLSEPLFLGTIEFRDDGTATLTPYQVLSDYIPSTGPAEMTWTYEDGYFEGAESADGVYRFNSSDCMDLGDRQINDGSVATFGDAEGTLYLTRP